MVDVQELKVESVCLLEALQAGSVDQILNDVPLDELRQTGGIVQNRVQFRSVDQRESLVRRGEHRVRSG